MKKIEAYQDKTGALHTTAREARIADFVADFRVLVPNIDPCEYGGIGDYARQLEYNRIIQAVADRAPAIVAALKNSGLTECS